MARTVTGRLLVTGDLVARTVLHVGGMGEDVASDMPLARDGAGRFVVPGTSLAGAFRAWCERVFAGDVAREIWGSAEDDGAASRVVIDDVVAGTDASAFVEVRDGVGIDREWGTAAHAIKYDRAVLPRGTRLPLRMTIEHDRGTAAAAREMAAALAAALADGDVSLGAAKTRGLGRVVLERGRVEQFDLESREGTLALLRRLAWSAAGAKASAAPPATAVIPAAAAPLAPPRLSIEIDWRPVGPLMVKAGADGIAVDTLPLLGGSDGGLAMLLPGSSVKGVLRAQGERIIRTLLDLPLGTAPRPLARFLAQVRDVPLVDALFGAAGESTADDDGDGGARGRGHCDDDADPLPGLGALAVEDCHGRTGIPRDAWDCILSADIEPPEGTTGSPLRRALDDAGLRDWTPAFHVAIDRWTGGAADQLLFTVMEPCRVDWEPLRLAVDLARLPRAERSAGVALLLLLLHDLARGRLPLGFGTNRGLGAVAVDRIRVRGRGLGGHLAPLADVELTGGDLGGLPPGVRDRLAGEWRTWLDRVAREARR